MDRSISSKGGRTTVQRHGKTHMAEIGARGFETTVNRHWGGDRASYLKYLRERANESVMEGFVDRELARRRDQGEEVESIELPVLSEPDDELPW